MIILKRFLFINYSYLKSVVGVGFIRNLKSDNGIDRRPMDLKHFFRSANEQTEPLFANVKGTIPDWLEGVLVRIGPAKFDFHDFTVNHWFDGYAMLYNFVIKDGQATYRARYLKSEAYEKANQVGRPVFTEFGTKAYPDPSKNILSRIFSKLVPTDLTDNDVINVYQMCNELFCATESCHIKQVDPFTLHTLKKVDMNKTAGVNITSAHPHVASDGTGYNIGSSFMTGLKYHVLKMSPPSMSQSKFHLVEEAEEEEDDDDEAVEALEQLDRPKTYLDHDDDNADKFIMNMTTIIEGDIKETMTPSPSPSSTTVTYRDPKILANLSCRWTATFSYYHSFGMSQNYIVFIEQPLLINSLKMATIKIKGRSYRDCLEWRPEEKCKFVVIDKTSGAVSKTCYLSDSFFIFHHINTYEEDGHLIADVITYRNIDIIDMYFLCNLRDKPYTGAEPPRAQRYVLPLGHRADGPIGSNLVKLNYTVATAERQHDGTIHLTSESLAEPGFELPQINYKYYNSRKYSYVYGSGCFEPGYYRNAVCKVNVQTKATTIWRHCDNCYPGEAVFVGRPGATEEDDGVLLSVAIDRRPDVTDFLVILDARTMKELARCEVPVNIPALLHGTFVPWPSI